MQAIWLKATPTCGVKYISRSPHKSNGWQSSWLVFCYLYQRKFDSELNILQNRDATPDGLRWLWRSDVGYYVDVLSESNTFNNISGGMYSSSSILTVILLYTTEYKWTHLDIINRCGRSTSVLTALVKTKRLYMNMTMDIMYVSHDGSCQS